MWGIWTLLFVIPDSPRISGTFLILSREGLVSPGNRKVMVFYLKLCYPIAAYFLPSSAFGSVQGRTHPHTPRQVILVPHAHSLLPCASIMLGYPQPACRPPSSSCPLGISPPEHTSLFFSVCLDTQAPCGWWGLLFANSKALAGTLTLTLLLSFTAKLSLRVVFIHDLFSFPSQSHLHTRTPQQSSYHSYQSPTSCHLFSSHLAH